MKQRNYSAEIRLKTKELNVLKTYIGRLKVMQMESERNASHEVFKRHHTKAKTY